MQIFWPNLNAMNQFTMELDSQPDSLQCPHCRQTGQFVSHGFVYRKQQCGDGVAVGKRVLCSGRYGRSGCCRTQRLYLDTGLPGLHYRTTCLMVFLVSLFADHSISAAYQKATGADSPRHAYRWLAKLEHRLTTYRRLIHPRPPVLNESCSSRSRYRRIVLPTLRALFNLFDNGTTFQSRQQVAFI
jgi:hypothetical protein